MRKMRYLAPLAILSFICRKGSANDYSNLEENHLARELFETSKLADRSHQGIAKLFANSSPPIKRCRGQPLTQDAEQFNQQLTPHRAAIEGAKFFWIANDGY